MSKRGKTGVRGAALVLLSLLGALAAAGEGAPTLSAARATAPPQLDGRLEEADWRSAPVAEGFRSLDGSQAAPQATEVRVLYDDENLYFGWRCATRAPERLPREPAARDTYHIEAVEIFLAPHADPSAYYQFVVSAANTLFDSRGMVDSSWSTPARSATSGGPDFWSGELAVPWAALGLAPDTPRQWGLELGRSDTTAAEAPCYSAWAPTGGNFHVPGRFGVLTGLAVDWSRFWWEARSVPREAAPGRPLGEVALANLTGAAWRGTLSAAVAGEGAEAAENTQALAVGQGGVLQARLPLLRPAGDRPRLRLSLRDSAGRLCYWAETPLEPVPLLSARLDQRFYSTETQARLTTTLNSSQLSPGTLSVRVLDRQSRRVVFSQRRTEPTPGLLEWSLPCAGLAPGDYPVQVTLREPGAPPLVVRQVLRRRAPLPGEVKTDPRGGLVIDGQSFLPLGFYYLTGAPDEVLQQAAEAGFNTVVVEWADAAGCLAQLRRLAAWGYRGLLGMGSSYYVWNAPTWEGKLAAARKLVAGVTRAAPPNLLGWYVWDEPTPPSPEPIEMAELVREQDVAHPTTTCCYQIPHARYYAPYVDLMTTDPYPGFPGGVLTKVSEFQDAAVRAMGPGGTTCTVIQAFYDEGMGRMPTPAEERAMTWLALVHGAQGILYFSYSYNGDLPQKHPEVWQALLDLAREISSLREVILASPPPGGSAQVTPANAVHLMLREQGGEAYLFLVNPGEQAIPRVVVTLHGLRARNACSVSSEERYPVRGGELELPLEAFGTRVLRLTR